ncbi:hypothetical protein SRHO_G00199140 [Serrasalmus rhombeus]
MTIHHVNTQMISNLRVLTKSSHRRMASNRSTVSVLSVYCISRPSRWLSSSPEERNKPLAELDTVYNSWLELV